eukprot:GILJ01012764.1.p2 GENE.GILJ01012764.1~~GILJ01012764.1.p2  ORF type:complete len:247 (+),score=16.05 GILJ01012764.1:230-970(+)
MATTNDQSKIEELTTQRNFAVGTTCVVGLAGVAGFISYTNQGNLINEMRAQISEQQSQNDILRAQVAQYVSASASSGVPVVERQRVAMGGLYTNPLGGFLNLSYRGAGIFVLTQITDRVLADECASAPVNGKVTVGCTDHKTLSNGMTQIFQSPMGLSRFPKIVMTIDSTNTKLSWSQSGLTINMVWDPQTKLMNIMFDQRTTSISTIQPDPSKPATTTTTTGGARADFTTQSLELMLMQPDVSPY